MSRKWLVGLDGLGLRGWNIGMEWLRQNNFSLDWLNLEIAINIHDFWHVLEGVIRDEIE